MLSLPASLAAQEREPLIFDRPTVDLMGAEAMPMMILEERTLAGGLYERELYPAEPWAEATACVAKLARERGFELPVPMGAPPALLVVPVARTIRVSDMTLDSLDYAEDSTHVGSTFSAPTIAYTLVRSEAVIVVERYKQNLPVLRHEALHLILWRTMKLYGHPEEFFMPCDKGYDEFMK